MVDGIESVNQQTRTLEGIRRVDQMVRSRDYDAQENRWVGEPIWSPVMAVPATSETSPSPAKPSRRFPLKRT